MKKSDRAVRVAVLILTLGILYFIAALIFYGVFLDSIIASMHSGKSHPFLNWLIYARHTNPLASDLAIAQIRFSKLSLIVVFADVALAACDRG
jgi:hypothetical protein